MTKKNFSCKTQNVNENSTKQGANVKPNRKLRKNVTVNKQKNSGPKESAERN